MTNRIYQAGGLRITDTDGDVLEADLDTYSGDALLTFQKGSMVSLTKADARALIDHLEPVAAPKKTAAELTSDEALAWLRDAFARCTEPDPGEYAAVPWGRGLVNELADQYGDRFFDDDYLDNDTAAGARFFLLTPAAVAALGEFSPVPARPADDDLVQIQIGPWDDFRSVSAVLDREGLELVDAIDYNLSDVTESGDRAPGVRFLSAAAVEALGEFRPVTLPDPDLYAAGDQVWAIHRPYFTLTAGRLTVIERSSLVTDAEAYLVEDKHGNRQHVYARDLHRPGSPANCPACDREDAA